MNRFCKDCDQYATCRYKHKAEKLFTSMLTNEVITADDVLALLKITHAALATRCKRYRLREDKDDK